MKIRIIRNVDEHVVCEIRLDTEKFVENNLPFICVSNYYHIQYLTDDNIPFDWTTGEVLPSDIKEADIKLSSGYYDNKELSLY